MGEKLNGQHEINLPKDGESNSKHENNSPKLRVRQYKNNSPKGSMGGELNDWHNSPKDGELNVRHENSSPKGWTAQK